MEWKETKQTVYTAQTICDEAEERAVDMDIVLPDYQPPIAAVIKCMMKPVVTACAEIGDRYTVDGITTVRMLYVSDDREQVHCYEQSQPFSVSFRAEGAVHHDVGVKVDYINCRATAPRRADVHGAFRVCMKAVGCGGVDLFAVPQNDTVFCRTLPINCTVPTHETTKSFSLEEMIEIGVQADKILYTDVEVASYECKALINKAIIKGVLQVCCAYESENQMSMITQEIPFSQIVDVDGLCEEWQCATEIHVSEMSCHLQHGESGGAQLLVNTRLMAFLRCSTTQSSTVVLDAYSVKESVICEAMTIHTSTMASFSPVKTGCHQQISVPENVMDVIAVWGDVRSKEIKIEQERPMLYCCLTISMLVHDKDGAIQYVERTVDVSSACDSSWNEAKVKCTNVQATVNGDRILLQIELLVMPCGKENNAFTVVSDVVADEHAAFTKSAAAIRIVYADRGDTLWEIAKMHHASVDDIIAENDIHDEVFMTPTMLMIPMV